MLSVYLQNSGRGEEDLSEILHCTQLLYTALAEYRGRISLSQGGVATITLCAPHPSPWCRECVEGRPRDRAWLLLHSWLLQDLGRAERVKRCLKVLFAPSIPVLSAGTNLTINRPVGYNLTTASLLNGHHKIIPYSFFSPLG